MRYEDAKDLLLSEGYRIVAEDFEDDVVYDDVVDTNTEELPVEDETLDSDVFGEIESGLGDEGFDATEVADIMTSNTEKINELIEKGVGTDDIVKILAYDNCEECDDDEECADGECCEDGECVACDDDLDEACEDIDSLPIECLDIFKLLTGRGYDDIGAKSWIKANKNKIEMFLDKGYSAEDIVYELDGDLAGDMDESLEDDFPETFRKPNTVQKGTDDWSDFKDDFRKKTLTLKKALTPKFVSGIIKDTDFEVDDKEIKEFAFRAIEEVWNTKNAVENLQARIRKHFVG
jgi:hypothetical protein